MESLTFKIKEFSKNSIIEITEILFYKESNITQKFIGNVLDELLTKKVILCRYISFLFLFLIISSTSFSKNYYISSLGDDANDGLTTTTAWQSITKLNASFGIIEAGDSILFKCNETFYGSVIVSKSGTKSLPIVFSSYGTGNKPVITGFTDLTSWTNMGGNIWKTNITDASDKLLLVSINNKLQRMGRYPNYNAKTGGYLTYEDFNSSAPSITDNQLPASPNWTGADAVIKKYSYVIDVCPITAQSGGTLTYTMPLNQYNQPTNGYGTKGYGYFIQNDIRTLDQFGEWFFDKKTKELSIYFDTNDPSNYSIKASTVDILFNCGGGGVGLPASTERTNISIKNLFLEGANKFGFFSFNGQNMTVQNCTFNNNYEAIYMWNVPNSLSDNNFITNTLNNGIHQLGAVSSPTLIMNNTINNCGLLEGMGGNGGGSYQGIIQNGDNTTIQKNILDSIGYIAIYFNGANILIKNNFIKNYCAILDDGGGIYTYADQNKKNRVIESNIVINGIGGRRGRPEDDAMTHGIYTDGSSRYITIKNNTVSQTDGSGYMMNTGNDIILTGNTFYNVPNAIRINRFFSPNDPTCRNNTITSNICYPTQNNFFYWNGQLNNPVVIDIKSDMRLIGTFDYNFYRNDLSAPFDYFYHLKPNGTFVDPPSLKFSEWQTYINGDTNSQLLSTAPNVFQYNSTSNPIVYNFQGHSKKDVFGVTYNESYTIPAFSSVILWDASIVMPPTIGAVIQPTCSEETGSVVLNSLPVTGTWTLTRIPGGTITTGTGSSYTITGLVPGTYTYTVTDGISGITSVSSGNVNISNQTAKPSAPTVGMITQPTCTLETGGVELTGLPGGTWTLTRTPGGISTTGTGTWSGITGLAPGIYTYSVTRAAGCTSVESKNVVINVQPQPTTPQITLEGNVLYSDATTGNQWYNQNGIIDGATYQDNTATSTGDYYVIITSEDCVSNPSNTIHVIPTGIDINENKIIFNVYPNPVTNELNIEIKANTTNKGFEIIDSIGQIVFKGCLLEKTTVQTSNFSPGNYIIKLENGNIFEFKNIVKK